MEDQKSYTVRTDTGEIRLMSQEEVAKLVRSSMERAKSLTPTARSSSKLSDSSVAYAASTVTSRRLSLSPRITNATGKYHFNRRQEKQRKGTKAETSRIFRDFREAISSGSASSIIQEEAEPVNPSKTERDTGPEKPIRRGTTINERFTAMVKTSTPREFGTEAREGNSIIGSADWEQSSVKSFTVSTEAEGKKNLSETEISDLVRDSIRRARRNAKVKSRKHLDTSSNKISFQKETAGSLSPQSSVNRKFSWSSVEKSDDEDIELRDDANEGDRSQRRDEVPPPEAIQPTSRDEVASPKAAQLEKWNEVVTGMIDTTNSSKVKERLTVGIVVQEQEVEVNDTPTIALDSVEVTLTPPQSSPEVANGALATPLTLKFPAEISNNNISNPEMLHEAPALSDVMSTGGESTLSGNEIIMRVQHSMDRAKLARVENREVAGTPQTLKIQGDTLDDKTSSRGRLHELPVSPDSHSMGGESVLSEKNKVSSLGRWLEAPSLSGILSTGGESVLSDNDIVLMVQSSMDRAKHARVEITELLQDTALKRGVKLSEVTDIVQDTMRRARESAHGIDSPSSLKTKETTQQTARPIGIQLTAGSPTSPSSTASCGKKYRAFLMSGESELKESLTSCGEISLPSVSTSLTFPATQLPEEASSPLSRALCDPGSNKEAYISVFSNGIAAITAVEATNQRLLPSSSIDDKLYAEVSRKIFDGGQPHENNVTVAEDTILTSDLLTKPSTAPGDLCCLPVDVSNTMSQSSSANELEVRTKFRPIASKVANSLDCTEGSCDMGVEVTVICASTSSAESVAVSASASSAESVADLTPATEQAQPSDPSVNVLSKADPQEPMNTIDISGPLVAEPTNIFDVTGLTNVFDVSGLSISSDLKMQSPRNFCDKAEDSINEIPTSAITLEKEPLCGANEEGKFIALTDECVPVPVADGHDAQGAMADEGHPSIATDDFKEEKPMTPTDKSNLSSTFAATRATAPTGPASTATPSSAGIKNEVQETGLTAKRRPLLMIKKSASSDDERSFTMSVHPRLSDATHSITSGKEFSLSEASQRRRRYSQKSRLRRPRKSRSMKPTPSRQVKESKETVITEEFLAKVASKKGAKVTADELARMLKGATGKRSEINEDSIKDEESQHMHSTSMEGTCLSEHQSEDWTREFQSSRSRSDSSRSRRRAKSRPSVQSQFCIDFMDLFAVDECVFNNSAIMDLDVDEFEEENSTNGGELTDNGGDDRTTNKADATGFRRVTFSFSDGRRSDLEYDVSSSDES